MAEFTLSTTPIRQPQSLFELVTDLGGEIIGTGEALMGQLVDHWQSTGLQPALMPASTTLQHHQLY